MTLPNALPFRCKAHSSNHNVIQILNGTFYRQHPTPVANFPLYPNLDFSLPAFPLRRNADNAEKQHHWAVISGRGSTTFLEIFRGSHISLPPNARTFPYLSSEAIEAKDHRLRSPFRAIQYVGFSSQGRGTTAHASYLGARYESRREETDFSLLQYLQGETELNPVQKPQEQDEGLQSLLLQIIKDLGLERLTSMSVSNLSNGQTRRARIAKALLKRPEVLLLDEPFMGLDPPTLVSISSILRKLAYQSSPRLIMSLRPQDPIPDWITHLAVLGLDHTLALAGRKEEVLFATHRWANCYANPKGAIAARMANLMTAKYGQPLQDIGQTLSSNGVTRYQTYSRIISSTNPRYVQPGGEIAPEYLDAHDRELWRAAAQKSLQQADLDDLLALTCLLPKDLHQTNYRPVSGPAPSNDRKAAGLGSDHVQKRHREPLIELNNIVVSYGSKTVLGHGTQPGYSTSGLNLTIRQGTRLLLLGPNGSGKTTLLSLLTSDHPHSYSLPIKFFGRSRLPSPGKPGLSLWDIQSRIGHSSPEIHTFFPKHLTIRRTLESAWADTFSAKPQLTDERTRLVDAFLRWWEPELKQSYRSHFNAKPPVWPIDEFVLQAYPPVNSSTQPNTAQPALAWASSTANRFGTLPFQSQRLLLLLRAIIKSPDIVILDEAFSGLNAETREKAMLFLKRGEEMVFEPQLPGKMGQSHNTKNTRVLVDSVYREIGIETSDLLTDPNMLAPGKQEKVDRLRAMDHDQFTAIAGERSRGLEHAFKGLSAQQALIVVSHVREEVPDMVSEYLRLPGEEEVSEHGRAVEMGGCENGRVRTVEGWNRIWGVR